LAVSSYNALPVRRGSSGSAGGRLGWLAAVTKEARGASEVGDDGQEALIRRMAHENRLWGRAHRCGELLELGIRVAKRMVQKYLKVVGTRMIKTAVRTPDMNAICERFLGSVRRECLDHMIV